jgi:hypothetical protein
MRRGFLTRVPAIGCGAPAEAAARVAAFIALAALAGLAAGFSTNSWLAHAMQQVLYGLEGNRLSAWGNPPSLAPDGPAAGRAGWRCGRATLRRRGRR